MQNVCRLFFLSVVLNFAGKTAHSQLIEKASPSPVTVIAPPADSLNASIVVSDIIITGFKKTKPYIIQREIPFKKGENVSRSDLPSKLSLCKQQLMNTALFVDADVKAVALDSNHIFIDIHVKERWYLFPVPYFRVVSRNFNTWWVEEKHNLNRAEYGLKFMQNNVSGRNDDLNLWLISGFTQQFSLRYNNPNIDNKLKHGINIGFGIKRNRELNYGMDSIRPNKISFVKQDNRFIINQNYIDFAYTYRPAIRTRHTFRASYVNTGIDNLVLKLNPRYFASPDTRLRYIGLSYNLSYTNLDYIPYPLKGFGGSANIYKRIGRNADFWQISGTGNYNAKFAPRSFLQLQAAGLIRFPFNQPYISNNLMGSSDLYLRGLEYYVVEGVAGGVARATVKNEILSFNLNNPVNSKTYDKIPFRVFIKGYGDLGYSYTPNYGISRLNNKMLHTWGVGIDVTTFYDIAVRLEYSFNQLGDKGLFIHTQTDF